MLPALIGAANAKDAAPSFMSPFVPPLRDPQVAHSVAAQAQAKVIAEQCIPVVEPAPPGTNVDTLRSNSTFVLPGLKRRLKQTFCEPGNDTVNPILDVLKLLIIPEFRRDGKFGNEKFVNYVCFDGQLPTYWLFLSRII